MNAQEFRADWSTPMPERMGEIQDTVLLLAESTQNGFGLSAAEAKLLDLYRGYCSAVDLIALLATASESMRQRIASELKAAAGGQA